MGNARERERGTERARERSGRGQARHIKLPDEAVSIRACGVESWYVKPNAVRSRYEYFCHIFLTREGRNVVEAIHRRPPTGDVTLRVDACWYTTTSNSHLSSTVVRQVMHPVKAEVSTHVYSFPGETAWPFLPQKHEGFDASTAFVCYHAFALCGFGPARLPTPALLFSGTTFIEDLYYLWLFPLENPFKVEGHEGRRT